MYYMRLPTWDWLAAHDIHPSNSTTYYLSDIESALTQEYCDTPYVGCAGPRYNETLTGANSTDGGYTQLSEVWYYFHVLGRPQSGAWLPTNQTGSSSCARTKVAINYFERAAGSVGEGYNPYQNATPPALM
jgi:ribonuclease T2